MEVMDIPYDKEGVFLERRNRFLGIVDIVGEEVKVHVRDPGRLREILYPGNKVRVSKADNPDRKTDWDLIAGKVDDNWILVNSVFHRKISRSILEDSEIDPFERNEGWQAEKKLGNSRIDFLHERNGERLWVEVKGCTLAKNKVALFPDAPTTRGTRHVRELIGAVENGNDAGLLILVFRPDAECFSPYTERDPDLAAAFWDAVDAGVQVHPLKFEYTSGRLYYRREIPICDER